MNKIFLINVLLAFTWCAVQGSFTFINLIFGFLISSARSRAGGPRLSHIWQR